MKMLNTEERMEALGVTKSAITGLVVRLINTGFIKRIRYESDRRVVKIKLTKKGADLARKFNDFRLKIIMRFFVNVSRTERMQY